MLRRAGRPGELAVDEVAQGAFIGLVIPPEKTDRADWKLAGIEAGPLCHLPVRNVA